MAGDRYKFTCGVSSFKYSSMTLDFQNDAGEKLATGTTEIFEDVQGGAYTVIETAPAGATIAAVGIYGLEGSGFQDCTLLLETPVPTPVDGSISGMAWFDENGDALRANTESVVPSTPVSLFLGATSIAQAETGLDGGYYFGGLDLGACYRLQFAPADPTLAFTAAGNDNAPGSDGFTQDLCLTDAAPNLADVHAGFVTSPPVVPPEDYAVCGSVFATVAGAAEPIGHVRVTLREVSTDELHETVSRANGRYAFTDLPAGDYRLQFEGPAGYEFTAGDASLTASASYADENGTTPQFNLPTASNTGPDAACTIRNANAGLIRTPVALDPTVAEDDEIEGTVGQTLSVPILGNDAPCDAEVLEVDLIGHNVPGLVTYDAVSGAFVISSTTASGSYSIEYGLRGACGIL